MAIVQAYPGQVLPQLWLSGFAITLDATTPNTILDIGAGIARDSNNVMDLVLGSANFEGQTVTAPLILNTAGTGANGLDTGTLGASHVYSVYVIGDSTYQRPVASLLSLASNSVPLMPGGYDSYRLIGYAVTDGSSHFLPMYISGSSNYRLFTYDAPIIAISSGTQTGYTGVALTNFVPPVNNTPVWLYSNFAANAAGNILNYQGYNSTGDAVTEIATVATGTANMTRNNRVLAQLNTAAPSIKYKVTAGTLNAYVTAFEYFL